MTLLMVIGIALAVGVLAMPARAVIDTGLVNRNARSEFFARFADTPSEIGNLAMQVNSTKDEENYRWLGMVARMRAWGTGRLAKGLRSESYDVANEKYESTMEVDRDEISDDQTGQIRMRIADLAVAARTHPDYLVAQLLINGATSGFVCYDGSVFFTTTHSSGASGNQDNALTATAAAALKTTAECQTALNAAIAAMMGFEDDQGEPMMIDQAGLVVAVPPPLYAPMAIATSAAIVSGTSNVFAGLARVWICPWLTTGTTFYLLKTQNINGAKPFIYQVREPIEFKSLAEGSDEEFKREKYLYGVRARYAVAYGYWQYAVRTVFNN